MEMERRETAAAAASAPTAMSRTRTRLVGSSVKFHLSSAVFPTTPGMLLPEASEAETIRADFRPETFAGSRNRRMMMRPPWPIVSAEA